MKNPLATDLIKERLNQKEVELIMKEYVNCMIHH